MIIQPKIRGFICLTAHPLGCAQHVQEQIDAVRAGGAIESGPLNVLVIGASTGYGLASRIAAAFGSGAKTLGLYWERPPSDTKPASAGWYNTEAFHQKAREAGLYAEGIQGDAFSDGLKQETIARIKEDLGSIDLVIYSLASPRRTHPRTGETFKSALKPIGQSYTAKTLNTDKKQIEEVTLDPANEEEIEATRQVMGGEDWEMWMTALDEAGVLSEGATTVAYSYIGPEITHPIYRHGTIGNAKEDLEQAAGRINTQLQKIQGKAMVSVNKAVVTQASSAIPVIPLYLSLLFKVMKEQNTHENCIQQIDRLFRTHRDAGATPTLDEAGLIRMDDWEMESSVQNAVQDLWGQVTTENIDTLTDFAGYQSEFLKLFGFGLPGIDYKADVPLNNG